MTTLDPGASEVLTHGLGARPRATARWATSPAATITWGLEVLVQLVMAATTTAPSPTVWVDPSASVAGSDRWSRSRAARYAAPAPASATRSWGREGPARLGVTVERSSS